MIGPLLMSLIAVIGGGVAFKAAFAKELRPWLRNPLLGGDEETERLERGMAGVAGIWFMLFGLLGIVENIYRIVTGTH